MWNKIATTISNFITPKKSKIRDIKELPGVISPIPSGNVANTEANALANYYAKEKRGEENAKIPSAFTPKTVDYSGLDKLGHTTPFVKPKTPAMPKIATVIATPTPKKATITPTPIKTWNDFAKLVISEGNNRGYSGETLARQKALESGFGTSEFARVRNNYGGIGAYDRNPNNAFSFKSPQEYLDYYFKMIEKRFPKAYGVRNNPRLYVQALKDANYATDPNYVEKVLNTQVYK